MSPNNPTILYAGIDVAKASFQLAWQGASHHLSNDAKGHTRLRRLLGDPSRCHVVLEASGGYEQPIASALHAHGYTLSIVEPGRVRGYARAKGRRAKSDPIDASVIQSFGATMQPTASTAPTPEKLRLQALVRRRSQLVALKVDEHNHGEHYSDPFVLRQAKALLKTLAAQIAQCEAQIAKLLAADPSSLARSSRLQQVSGIGPANAATLLAYLPELGSLRPEAAAALAGVAPFDNDSGSRSSPRHISGGRKDVRCALYMASITAIRYDSIFKAFYQRLLSTGKKPLVALTAVMRKLVILLNRLLKDPSFSLSHPKS